MEPDVGAKEEELRHFAKDIAEHLEKRLEAGDFERLVLVAAPETLGAIRKDLPKRLADVIVEEIPKDLVGHEPAAIQAHFS